MIPTLDLEWDDILTAAAGHGWWLIWHGGWNPPDSGLEVARINAHIAATSRVAATRPDGWDTTHHLDDWTGWITEQERFLHDSLAVFDHLENTHAA